jgi:hypothetical protein
MHDTDHRSPDELRRYNDQVWDTVLHLANPVFIYVIAQVLIISHLSAHHVFRRFEWPIYGAQFLGAWAMFYSTLLRDYAYRSLAAPILGAVAIAGAASQYLLLPSPADARPAVLAVFLGVQLVPAVLLWCVTMALWRRAKRRALRDRPPGQDA